VVLQLRSDPTAPTAIAPAIGGGLGWADRDTLRAHVAVEPWGPLDRVDDEERRERLRSADELVYTTVWAVTPGVDDPPETVELVLESRD